MQLYEIRLLNGDFTTRTIIAQQYISDHAAVRAARMFAEQTLFEVWRGLTCVYATAPLRASAAVPRASSGPKVSRPPVG